MKARAASVALSTAVLVLGILIGAVGMRAYDLRRATVWLRSPDADKRAQILETLLSRRLKLDPEQRRQMKAAIQRQRPAYNAMLADLRPSQFRLREELVEASRAFLHPEQLRRMQVLVAEVNAREKMQTSP